jgi:hypothetical protein
MSEREIIGQTKEDTREDRILNAPLKPATSDNSSEGGAVITPTYSKSMCQKHMVCNAEHVSNNFFTEK